MNIPPNRCYGRTTSRTVPMAGTLPNTTKGTSCLLLTKLRFFQYLTKDLKVYDPIPFGFIHRNGIFGIRCESSYFSRYLCQISYERKFSESSEMVVNSFSCVSFKSNISWVMRKMGAFRLSSDTKISIPIGISRRPSE